MPLKIIYVVGEGRSGSTVLDMVLGNSPRVSGVGELWAFLEDSEVAAGPCSCGSNVNDCSFWTEVKREFLRRAELSNLERPRSLRLKYDGLPHVAQHLLRLNCRSDFVEYCSYMRTLYGAISDVSKNSIIVDSTKQIGRALSLLDCPGLDVYFVHLVRDGRGVMWSRRRDFLSGDPARDYGRVHRSPYSTILKWSVKNVLALWLGGRAERRYILVRYEDLAKDPASTVLRIGRCVGEDFSQLAEALRTDQPMAAAHQIGGNQRARSRPIRLRSDTQWTHSLPLHHQWLFWVLAGPLAKRLGYKRAEYIS